MLTSRLQAGLWSQCTQTQETCGIFNLAHQKYIEEMQAIPTLPVLFYNEFIQFHSYDLRKLKKNSNTAGSKLNRFNQFNGTASGTA